MFIQFIHLHPRSFSLILHQVASQIWFSINFPCAENTWVPNTIILAQCDPTCYERPRAPFEAWNRSGSWDPKTPIKKDRVRSGNRDQLWSPQKSGYCRTRFDGFSNSNWNVHKNIHNIEIMYWRTVHLYTVSIPQSPNTKKYKKHGLHEISWVWFWVNMEPDLGGEVWDVAKICGSQPADLWFQARQLHVVPSGLQGWGHCSTQISESLSGVEDQSAFWESDVWKE